MSRRHARSLRAVAVLREPVFSPGMVEHDAAILRQAASELTTRHGIECPVIGAQDLAALAALPDDDDGKGSRPRTPRLVLSMAEGEESLALLERIEKRGAIVVNSPASVRSTRRAALLDLSQPRGPLVEGALVATDDGDRIPDRILEGGQAWVKRADYHALQKGDVVRVGSREVISALRAMHARGIGSAVVQPHIPGPVLKFYGVAPHHPRWHHPLSRGGGGKNAPFFRWFVTEGGASPDAATTARLERSVLDAAGRAGLSVFGGDAVLPERGAPAPVLVDLNAWPSFWRCRADAATAIADHAASLLEASRAKRKPARPARSR